MYDLDKLLEAIKRAILDNFPSLLVGLAVGILLVVLVTASSSRTYNSTDNKQTKERSGIKIYTDNLTGCQYLRFGIFGGTLPRVKDNKHLGCNSRRM